MRAVVYKGPNKIVVEEVDDPKIEDPRDALIKLTSTAICGSDLHMYEGRTVSQPGTVLGHEPLGIIEEVGDAVTSLKKGDRVVVTFNVACGHCFNCARGFSNACLTVNPEIAGGAFGYAKMGPYRGAQAEMLRVPFAEFNCTKLPGSPGDKWEDDFVLLADIFPTGYFATQLAMVKAGSSVAVFGAGPVGLLSAYSAMLQGAAQVFVVDNIRERLNLAKSICAIPIDFSECDPVDQIEALRTGNAEIIETLLPGEEKIKGVMSGIDAVGYQARDRKDPSKENPTQVINDLIRLVNPTGHIGVIGVFMSNDPGGVDEYAKKGEYILPFGKLWEKGISVGTGQTPVKGIHLMLRDMIIGGKAKPSFIVSHRISLDEVPDAYREFDQRTNGYTKVIIKPQK
jgi:glutathione-independent formaldehyde dehydrogenase